ncbi:hypothetical protein ACFQ48_19365 [Hymenobacter caeli]|uniref:Uncharacterized protein n=1 Tax=Hymenobacter caeli TaxID=2735894 RepID=A0ABX2FVE9_9BACT|nr:hypothetical protein [Hymenobacter caeli]NRT21119.1 hypothetical protein [Hymenobacter caeli]
MQRTEELLANIRRARKRTGAILADGLFEAVIERSKLSGFAVVDGSVLHSGRVLLTDDQLLDKVKLLAGGVPCLFLNLEMYVAPRLNDPGYLKQLVHKLVVMEPKQPIVFLLYSAKVFSSFDSIYSQSLPTSQHTLNLTDNQYFA